MKILFAATLAVSLIATGGCASRPTIPDWINGPAEKYPSGQYLVGLDAGLGERNL